MSPVHPFLPGLAEKIAIGAVKSLLRASALGIQKRLGRSEEEKALQAAVAEALVEAMAGQELEEERSAHYASLLEEFFAREEAAIELSQLLDPRPDQTPDLDTLAREFRRAEFDPDTMDGFDLDKFLRSFLSAFYAAAARRPPLQGGINLKVLGAQLEQLGRVAAAGERSADSLDEIKVLLKSFVTGQSELAELRRQVEAALAGGFLPAYHTYEAIGAGLLKEGIDFGVNAAGDLEITGPAPSATRELPPARLEEVRLLAGELRQTVVEHRPSAEELDVLEVRYRQHVIRWFENLTFQGMMRAPRPIVLPLEDVYVELRAVAEVPEAADAFSVEERRLLLEIEDRDDSGRRELMSQLDAFRRERWSRTIPERKSMAEALHQRDRRAFVILGDPGSGKTTLLHFLALVYARGPETAAQRLGVDPAEADRLPIFVPLAAFDDMLRESRRLGESLTLRDFLPRYYDRRRGLPGLEPLFRRALDSGRALVLLDGLDEVLDVGTRTYVAQQASALIGEQSARGVRFAVSSRFVGYREAPVPGLPTLSVLDFGTPEIETFVRRWAQAFERWAAQDLENPEMLRRAQTLEAGLMDDVRSNESVRRLAANPLMLTMLALLRRQVGRLPQRRVQLYESYVGTLLENWVDARSEGARETSVEILDRHEAENILIPLALWLQKEKPSGTAGRAEIRNHLVEICLRDRGLDPTKADRAAKREAEEKAERFLQEMRQMAGLIIERGHDAYGFLHLTFQEYFAGRGLAQLSDQERWETIRRHLHDPRWREPILLCAGRLGVVENRRPQVTHLVRDILEHEDPVEADLHRNLLLALAIACDDVNLEPTLVNELVERAMTLLATPVYALARELLRLLGQLIVNGMARFELCLQRVEGAENRVLERIAIEEWGRFAEVKEIDAWLKAQLDNDDGWIVSAALDVLAPRLREDASLWQKAVRFLGRSASDSAARALAQIAPTHPEIRKLLLDRLKTKNRDIRGSALVALSGLVPSDAEVRNVFLRSLNDRETKGAAARGLAGLAGQDAEVREALLKAGAIDALADLVEEDAEVRRVILENLNAGSLGAVKALSPILATDPEALAKVADLLEHGMNLAGLLESLKVCLPGVSRIQEAFLKAMGAADWKVRRAACQGLGESGAAPRDLLLGLLHKRDTLESREIFQHCALLADVQLSREWIEYWMEALCHPEPHRREAAVVALRHRAEADQEIRRAVLERLGDGSWKVRHSAVSALSGLVGTDREVRGAVLERLTDGHREVGRSAIEALSGIVETDQEARRLLLKYVAVEELRNSALSALSGLVGTDEEARRLVLERLEDESRITRASALSWLSGFVGTDEEIRRLVWERLDDQDIFIRQSALSALSGLVGTDEEARRLALERLADQNDGMRASAVSALSGIVATGEEIRRAVLPRLEDKDSGVRRQAVRALASVAEDEAVRPLILAKLEDPDFSVRLQVVEAVAKAPEEALFEISMPQLWPWLNLDVPRWGFVDPAWARSAQAQLARRFGARIPADPRLRDDLLAMLRNPRGSARLGAALALLAWPGEPPADILSQVFAALEDPRGLEAYPAQLAAASFLINQNDTAAEAIVLCLEALDYGTRPWESIHSWEARQQAALVLGKLEPVSYEPRVYDKLLHVLHHDEDADVRDAAYGTLVRLARMRDRQGKAQPV